MLTPIFGRNNRPTRQAVRAIVDKFETKFTLLDVPVPKKRRVARSEENTVAYYAKRSWPTCFQDLIDSWTKATWSFETPKLLQLRSGKAWRKWRISSKNHSSFSCQFSAVILLGEESAWLLAEIWARLVVRSSERRIGEQVSSNFPTGDRSSSSRVRPDSGIALSVVASMLGI